MKKRYLASLISLSLLSKSTFAQNDISSAQSLDTLTVTAQKTPQPEHKVPESITVISAEKMKVAPLDPPSAIVQNTPNIVWHNWATNQGFFAIRGISALGSPVNNSDGTVGFSIDGVPSSMLGLSDTLLDVEHVEVLRGPQGTLWGSNTLGGAINVITHQPDGKHDVHVTGETGSNGYHTLGLVAGDSLIDNRLNGRFAMNIGHYSGDIDSEHTERLNKRNIENFRGSLRLFDDNNTSYTLSGSYNHDRGNAPFSLAQPANNKPVSGALTEPDQDSKLSALTLTIEHTGDHAKLTSVSGYQHTKVHNYVDGTDTILYQRLGIPAAFAFSSPGITDDDEQTFTQEIRLNSLDGTPLRWVVGASSNYIDAKRHWQNGAAPAANTQLTTWTSGLFGDATLPLSDRWSITAGARATTDRLKVHDQSDTYTPDQNVEGATSQNYATGRLALNYDWSNQATSYISIARGHSTKQYDLYNIPVNNKVSPAFPAATGITYETGTKLSLLDDRVKFDGSVFYNNIHNGALTLLNSTGTAFNTTYEDYYTTGAEFQVRALLAPGLTLNNGVGYTRAKLRNKDYLRRDVPNIPDWTINSSLVYSMPAEKIGISQGEVNTTLGYQYVAPRPIDVNNDISLPAYSLVNASIGWLNSDYEVSIFSQNLFNKRYETYGATDFNIPIVMVGRGRVVGLSVTAYL